MKITSDITYASKEDLEWKMFAAKLVQLAKAKVIEYICDTFYDSAIGQNNKPPPNPRGQSKSQHMLRTAYFAGQVGASVSLITAALLHDYGYLIHVDAPTHDEQVGADFLADYFKPAITEPIRLHIAAKRYLCAVEPNYIMSLSPISRQNLRWQGGPFNSAQVKYFECLPYFTDAIQLRRYHEMSQQAILPTPKVEYFRPFLETGLKE